MSNFIQKCLIGEALPSDIDDYIDEWHEGNSDLELHEYLGLSKKEYALFVEDECYLPLLLTSHKEQIPIKELFEKTDTSITSGSDEASKSEIEMIKEMPVEIIKEVEVAKSIDMDALLKMMEQESNVKVPETVIGEKHIVGKTEKKSTVKAKRDDLKKKI